MRNENSAFFGRLSVLLLFLWRPARSGAFGRPSELVGIMAFVCSEKRVLVSPRTIREGGP